MQFHWFISSIIEVNQLYHIDRFQVCSSSFIIKLKSYWLLLIIFISCYSEASITCIYFFKPWLDENMCFLIYYKLFCYVHIWINIAVTSDTQLNSWLSAALTIRFMIRFTSYDRIHVIKTAVTLLLYLNLCAYRVRCSSATRHTYLIDLQRYDNRS